MALLIRESTPCPGGRMVTIEVTNAYTDGRSRFEEVFVSRDELRGRTREERRQAIYDAINDSLGDITGETVAEPTQTKEVLEQKMIERYATWLRWETTRAEAVKRNEPNLQNAVTNKTNQAWTRYVEILQLWRVAP